MEKEERERIRQAYLQEEEQMVEHGIYQLFVNTEATLASSYEELNRKVRSEFPSLHLPGSREFIARIKFEATHQFALGNDQLTEAFVGKLLDLLPHLTPERKNIILQKALLEAGDFWEGILEQSDNSSDTTMIARMRLTKINERLEAISHKK